MKEIKDVLLKFGIEHEHYEAILVVGLRKDGSYDHGVHCLQKQFPRLVETTGAVLRRVQSAMKTKMEKMARRN